MTLRATNPRTGETGEAVPTAAPADVAHAAGRAAAAAPAWREATGRSRGRLLREMADRLEMRRSDIIRVASFETGLPDTRFAGELTRTTEQLRSFAALVEEGSYVEAILSPAEGDTVPDVRRCLVPVGPVGVLTPSNFPLAFGVAGGDTASALAAGCPVIVKSHPAHPGTSALCYEACVRAVSATGEAPGVLSLIQGAAPELSRALVQAPELEAVAFTGSQAVGRLLHDLVATRPRPVPFHAELGSVNPVFIGQHAASARSAGIARGLADSMLLGHGQFCTKPGLVFLSEGDTGDVLLATLARHMSRRGADPLLSLGHRESLDRRLTATAGIDGVEEVTEAAGADPAGCAVPPRLFTVDLETFRRHPSLAEEHFGPVGIVVRYPLDEAADVAALLAGQLTATLHADAGDQAWASRLLPVLTQRVGRVIWNGFPTGVAVVPAMHHGGPYPASTSPLHSAIGATAIRRFLRPVAFQAMPDALLPPALQDANPLGIQRLVRGEWTRRRVSGRSDA